MSGPEPAFVVGIDLGTTHTAVASAPAGGGDVEVFPLPQLSAPAELSPGLEKLASTIYLPTKDEVPPESWRLPWGDPATFDGDSEGGAGRSMSTRYFLGAFAQQQGARVPGRQIVSAKSWLSYAAVDRRAPTLPWGGLEDVPRLSPVEVSARILAHVRGAWDHAHPDAPLAKQDVIVTVPASFDEVARALTAEAATLAGLPRIRLLEEPQAAFYDHLRAHSSQILAAIGDARLMLVVDVGGGTTDLTLVRVVRSEGQPPALERIAVGEHLMLGGDNMDAALARHVEQELTGSVGSLSAAQWAQLVQAARLGKETLLAASPPDEVAVALAGRGKKLLGGTRSHNVSGEVAERLLLDGFFPFTGVDEVPARRGRAALTALGLPYAQEPAIPKHVAAFLRSHAAACAETGVRVFDGLPRPDAVLLNGGVFQAAKIRARFLDVIAAWFDGERVPAWPTPEQTDALDLAVARGAASYALVRRGHGVRIGGGAPRSYFVAVDDDGTERALCVAPRGMLEGEAHEVARTFSVTLGKPVSFPLLTSTADSARRTGDLVDLDDLEALPPVQTVLTPPAEVPVRLHAHLTEVGTLEIALKMTNEALSSWRLDFSTRVTGDGADEVEGEVAERQALPARMDEAKGLVEAFFGSKAADVDPGGVKQLRRRLEKILGPRETWSVAASRELFGSLIANAKRRRRSADHERVFFQLAGYTLRPGYGAPLDDWRIGELWKLYEPGVQYVKDKPNWAAFWLMWRRVCGGLDVQQQRQIYDALKYFVTPRGQREGKAPKGPKPAGTDEMVRLVASLERLPANDKVELGGFVLHMLEHLELRTWWPLGRLGSRQPLRGSVHDVIPVDIAEDWLERLLAKKWLKEDGAGFAAAQIARQTGDRARDVDEGLRDRVARKLQEMRAPDPWVRMVLEIIDLGDDEEAAVLGDSLPVGLRLR